MIVRLRLERLDKSWRRWKDVVASRPVVLKSHKLNQLMYLSFKIRVKENQLTARPEVEQRAE